MNRAASASLFIALLLVACQGGDKRSPTELAPEETVELTAEQAAYLDEVSDVFRDFSADVGNGNCENLDEGIEACDVFRFTRALDRFLIMFLGVEPPTEVAAEHERFDEEANKLVEVVESESAAEREIEEQARSYQAALDDWLGAISDHFGVVPYVVETTNMWPTFCTHDVVFFERTDGEFKRWQLVVYDVAGEGFGAGRITGLGGEEVEFRDEQIFIDGIANSDPYPVDIDFTYGPERVPDGSFLVVSDDRNYSIEEFVKPEDIVGELGSLSAECERY
jgi:signal peptidase I